MWTAAAAGYAESIELLTRPFAGPLLDVLGLAAGDQGTRLLDVAAGTGVVALEAARRGVTVVATDFAPDMLVELRRRAGDERLDVRTELRDGQDLGFDDGSFDFATSAFGLIFFPAPAAGLAELHRVLRLGGRAGITSWQLAATGIPQLISAALARVAPGISQAPRPPWASLGHAAALGDALRAAGFTHVAVHQVTRNQCIDAPRSFFRHVSDWSPRLRPLLAALTADQLDMAADTFAELLASHSTREGLPATVLIAVGTRN
jgi:SAM-dependent methyltransferase